MAGTIPVKIITADGQAAGGLVGPWFGRNHSFKLAGAGDSAGALPMTQATYDAISSTTFDPSSIANLWGWYRLGVGITQSANLVTAWADQSGLGHDITNAGGTARPTLQGDNTILFDGAANQLRITSVTLNQPSTVVMLCKQVTFNAFVGRLCDGGGGNQGGVFQDTPSPNIVAYAGTSSPDNGTLTIDSWGVLQVIWNGASSSLQIGTQTATTGNFGASNMSGFTLGNFGDGSGSSGGNARFAEIAIYSAALSAGNLASLRTYMGSRGIPVDIP